MHSWQGINEFVSVVEQSSFTGAARHLNVSTAHVSRSVNNLEKRLAVKLLHRSTRQVSTTVAGNVYYRQCKQLLDGLADANRTIGRLNTSPSGLVKLTAPIYYGEHVIAPLLSKLMLQYPEIEFDLQLCNHNVDLISEGVDIAIRLGHLSDSSLIAKRIASRFYHVVASSSFISHYGQPDSVKDLKTYNCLRGINDYWQFSIGHRRKECRVTGNWRCNSGIAVMQAAIDGIGIAQLPNYYIDQPVADGDLITLLEDYNPGAEGIWVVYPQNRHLSTKLRIVIDFLASELG